MPNLVILTAGHIHTPQFVDTLKKRGGDYKIKGVYDPDPAVAKKYAEALSAPAVADPLALVNDPSVQAAVVTGTTAQHAGVVEAAARAKKHLFVEKPLATNLPDALRFYTAIKESGVIFQTGHFMRSDAKYRFVKAEIAAGNLGTVTRARYSNVHSGALGGWFDKDYRWFFQPDQAGGGGFLDLGCHALDILIYFLGPVAAATAALSGGLKYPNIDEYGEGLLKFKSGVIGTIVGGWVDAANPVPLQISGTEGAIWESNWQIFYSSSKSKIPGADGKQPVDPKHFPPGLPGAFDLFLDALAGKAKPADLIPLDDALHVVKAMDAMYTGFKNNAWVNVL